MMKLNFKSDLIFRNEKALEKFHKAFNGVFKQWVFQLLMLLIFLLGMTIQLLWEKIEMKFWPCKFDLNGPV